jgi:hypothetical protein
MLIPSWVGGTYISQSVVAANERTVNFYVEPINAPGAKARGALYPRPGVDVFATVSTAGVWRARFAENGRAFGIIGSTLYEVFADGTMTSRGTVAIDGNPATICSNGDAGGQLGITSGDKFYSYDLNTDALTEVLASGATMAVMLDGYILVLDAATSTLQQSDLYDALTFDPTNIAQRSLASDPWVALAVSTSQRLVLLLGETTGEVWSNVGAFPFAFAPQANGLIQFGTGAPFSVRDVGGAFMWVTRTEGGEGQVAIATGLEPRIVSDESVALALTGYINDVGISDAVAETIEWIGHIFYLVTFPLADATWVYDPATGVWVEWLTWIAEEARYVAWRPLFHFYAFGKHLIGDRESSTLYELTADSAEDVDDRPIRWLRRGALPWANDQTIFCSEIRLLLEPGLGVADSASQGYDPEVAMAFSWNGGKTWSNERRRKIGKQGRYDTAVYWNRCGSGTKPMVEIIATDPVPHRWIGLDAALHQGIGAATR